MANQLRGAVYGLRVWLISPHPLPQVPAVAMGPEVTGLDVISDHPVGCGCEDLNCPGAYGAQESDTAGLTVATAGRLRRLYDLDAAALATATVLMGRPSPEVLAAAQIRVAGDGRALWTAQGSTIAVPEYAEALVRGWSGRPLLPPDWACDVASTYVTLRLEAVQRHAGVRLVDPTLPPLPPVAWHVRNDPGAAQLSWLTRSHALCPSSPGTYSTGGPFR